MPPSWKSARFTLISTPLKYLWAVGFVSLFLLTDVSVKAQTSPEAATNAFLIYRMAALYHVQPRKVDSVFSKDLYRLMLTAMDPDKMYLDQGDLKRLDSFKSKLDQEVIGRKVDFINLLADIFAARVHETDSIVALISRQPFDLTKPVTLTISEDSAFAEDLPARAQKLSLLFRRSLLESVADDYDDADSATRKKPLTLEPAARLRTARTFQREIRQTGKTPSSLMEFISRCWCESVAGCFDPHTEFFSPEKKQEFQGELGDKQMIFGFSIGDGKPGIIITRLKPGSPAYKSGQINEGDHVLAIQWEGGEEEDVSDSKPDEVHTIISSGGDKKLTLTLKKSDGSRRQVTLQKGASTDNDNEGKVKSCLLAGPKRIGFISLPAFYTRYEDNKAGNGCADDVAREILKLRKENIEGLILDLRYNGGGSVSEAVSLAGIFIDYGPVGMQRGQTGKVFVLKDANRGTIYDGPLLILVNGFTASASEILAAALQDYHRAFILGSPTFGKATAQVVLPLDTLVEKSVVQPTEFLKLTISRLYRVTGSSAQQSGVVPDFTLPDFTTMSSQREKTLPYSLTPVVADSNKYFHAYQPLPLPALKQFAQTYTDSSRFLKRTAGDLDSLAAIDSPHDEVLNLSTVLADHARSDEWVAHSVDFRHAAVFPFSIEWTPYEKQRMASDEELRNTNRQLKAILSGDPGVLLGYEIVSKMEGIKK